MIIKIDHIALSPKNPEAAIAVLEKNTYATVFSGSKMRNPEIKKELMESFSTYNSLALLESGSGAPIEIVDHGRVNNRNGGIIPVLRNITQVSMQKKNLAGLDGRKAPLFFINELWAEACIISDVGAGFAFNEALIKTRDLEQSVHFWSLFGFKRTAGSDGQPAMSLESFFQKPFRIHIAEEEGSEDWKLDDAGFNCMALVTNNASKEKEALDSEGIHTTRIEEVRTNRKRLNVFFVKNNGGEVVEIIGPAEAGDTI